MRGFLLFLLSLGRASSPSLYLSPRKRARSVSDGPGFKQPFAGRTSSSSGFSTNQTLTLSLRRIPTRSTQPANTSLPLPALRGEGRGEGLLILLSLLPLVGRASSPSLHLLHPLVGRASCPSLPYLSLPDSRASSPSFSSIRHHPQGGPSGSECSFFSPSPRLTPRPTQVSFAAGFFFSEPPPPFFSVFDSFFPSLFDSPAFFSASAFFL